MKELKVESGKCRTNIILVKLKFLIENFNSTNSNSLPTRLLCFIKIFYFAITHNEFTRMDGGCEFVVGSRWNYDFRFYVERVNSTANEFISPSRSFSVIFAVGFHSFSEKSTSKSDLFHLFHLQLSGDYYYVSSSLRNS